MAEITVCKRLSLSECGYDERWLQKRIYDDPSILGIDATEPVAAEKVQSSGGRLDLLLKDDEDGMYEVELQLGATDETHIIRTIEYWDMERKRWPNRSHYAVLVAERINSRFYNVVRLLSGAVPIIGIAVGIVEVGGQRALDFTTIIDLFEEPEVETDIEPEIYDRQHWLQNYPWVLAMAEWYQAVLNKHYGEVGVLMKYRKDQIVLNVGGLNKTWFHRRKSDRALLEVKFTESDFQEMVSEMEGRGMEVHTNQKHRQLTLNVNLQQLNDKAEAHEWLAPRIRPKKVIGGKGGESHD